MIKVPIDDADIETQFNDPPDSFSSAPAKGEIGLFSEILSDAIEYKSEENKCKTEYNSSMERISISKEV